VAPMASGERGTKKGPAVVPAPLMPCQGFYTHIRQRFGKTQTVQDA
jgi:hypothetical protein